MEEICRNYWYPVFSFYRGYGFSPTDAEDLTQDFFRAFILRETIRAVREEKGRLRTFILNMLREMAANHLRHRAALKRGGKMKLVPFDVGEAERAFSEESEGGTDSGARFDRAWAQRVMESARERLRADFARGDNLDDFELLQDFLPLSPVERAPAEAARRLGITESALRLQVHRMRKRFARHIEAEIAQTVADPGDQKAERDYLISLLGS